MDQGQDAGTDAGIAEEACKVGLLHLEFRLISLNEDLILLGFRALIGTQELKRKER